MKTYYNQPVYTNTKTRSLTMLTVWNVTQKDSYVIPSYHASRMIGMNGTKVTHYRGYVHLGGVKFIEVKGCSYNDRPVPHWNFVKHLKSEDIGFIDNRWPKPKDYLYKGSSQL